MQILFQIQFLINLLLWKKSVCPLNLKLYYTSSSTVFVRESRERKTRRRALKLLPVRNKVIQRGERLNPAILLALLSPRKVREFS